MKWKSVGRLVLGIVSAAVPAVQRVEQGIEALKAAKTSAEKNAAAVEIMKGSVATSEQVAERDLLNDAEVEAAMGAIVSAIVHAQNIVAKKQAERATSGTSGE